MEEVYIKVKNTVFEDLFQNKDIVSIEEVLTELVNLIDERDQLEEKINDLEKDIEEKYELRNIDPYAEYGISERDFV